MYKNMTYMLNHIKAFNNNTFSEIIKNKKIIIFGTGSGSENFIKKYKLLPSYFIDNDDTKWRKNFVNKEICKPEIIKRENFGQIFIFVASIYYSEISKQLEEMGLKENINYADGLNIEKILYIKKYENEPELPILTVKDLENIEERLKRELIKVEDFYIDNNEFEEFKQKYMFDNKYILYYECVSEEKLLEHYVAYKLLNLEDYKEDNLYIDVAACSSPWAKILREKNKNAYAIDLKVATEYNDLFYYKKLDATNTTFDDKSVQGMSLQCAYEMFLKDDDIEFIKEASRILKKGGKIVISPLYMHELYCSTSSPEYFRKGYSDKDSIEFIRRDYFGIPSARNYDVEHLKKRILNNANKYGLKYKIYVLRNKNDILGNIYLHFILELERL